MVAAMCSWHHHHDRAAEAIESRLDRRERMIVAAPALIETYSVLTRLPASYRLSAEVALGLVEANFLQSVKIVAMEAEAYRTLLRGAPAAGVSGGLTYDAVIAACARKEKVRTILTFNESHFRRFADPDLLIVVP